MHALSSVYQSRELYTFLYTMQKQQKYLPSTGVKSNRVQPMIIDLCQLCHFAVIVAGMSGAFKPWGDWEIKIHLLSCLYSL